MSQPSASEQPTLAHTAAPASEQATLAPGESPASAPPITFVPGYELLSELGRGGMGVVYKARQTKLNRIVALKMILAGSHAGAADLARFQTEAEAIARLQYPNIVQVYEVGEHEGKPFFSLEFCGGGSLEKKLNGTPLPPREAAALVEMLARAMQAAHEQHVIHRDLKPANVLLADNGTPKITDFGLAKRLDEASQTQSGAIMGTPSYMAPEQAGGKSGAIGPAVDVYALGAILYECLTGRPPFKAATAMDTMLQVLSDEPVSPSQLQTKTPRDLETICLKCLRKEPTNRYATAAELAEDLRRFQAGESIAARPAGVWELAWKWAKRRPAVAALVFVIALALLTLVGGGWWDNHRLQTSLSETLEAKGEIERLRQQELRQGEERLQEVNRQLSRRNLKSLAIAMYHYAEKHDNRFPPAAICGPDDKALLSWRVALLPHFADAERYLYSRFHLDEAWDSPHNRALLREIPDVYAPAEEPGRNPTATYFQVFTGKGAGFEGPKGQRIFDFTDGTSNTFLIVEGGEPVPWTKPQDLPFVPGGPLPKLGGLNPKGFHAALADGSVRLVPRDIDEAVIRAYITRNGGELLQLPPP